MNVLLIFMNKKIIQRILLVAVSKNYLKNTMLIAMRYLKNILLVAVSKNYLKNTVLIDCYEII